MAWPICSQFRLTNVAGHPTIGEVARLWLRDMVRTIFGAKSPEGRQLVNECFLMRSKKNAKSRIAAAKMLTAWLMNWRDDEAWERRWPRAGAKRQRAPQPMSVGGEQSAPMKKPAKDLPK